MSDGLPPQVHPPRGGEGGVAEAAAGAAASRALSGGTTPCGTELAVTPFVRQYAAVDPDWFAAQNLPAVQSWLRDWLASPLFIACMQKLAAPA